MKARLLLMILCCACTMSYAQKRAVYVISPLYITFQEMGSNSAGNQQETHTETPKASIQTETKSISIDKLEVDEQTLKDLCYIAYLYKSQSFDRKYQKEVSAKYNIDIIQQIVRKYTEEELKTRSKGHTKQLNKYSL